MKVAIAMATFNGAEYLSQQLASFCSQVRLPDQLVVTDDGSTDGTAAILEEFAKTAPFEVLIHTNPTNLGVTRNFDEALLRCTGDLCFLADQDDVWYPDKIAKIVTVFDAHPDAQLVINDARIVEYSRPTEWTKLGQTRSIGLADEHFINGCCTTLRAEFLKLVQPMPAEIAHDMWIHKLAVRLGSKIVCTEVLQDFRRHSSNASQGLSSQTRNLSKLDLAVKNMHKDTAQWCELNLQRLGLLRTRLDSHEAKEFLSQHAAAVEHKEIMAGIDREINAFQARQEVIGLPLHSRFVPALKMYFRGDYQVFSGWKSLLRDTWLG